MYRVLREHKIGRSAPFTCSVEPKQRNLELKVFYPPSDSWVKGHETGLWRKRGRRSRRIFPASDRVLRKEH